MLYVYKIKQNMQVKIPIQINDCHQKNYGKYWEWTWLHIVYDILKHFYPAQSNIKKKNPRIDRKLNKFYYLAFKQF